MDAVKHVLHLGAFSGFVLVSIALFFHKESNLITPSIEEYSVALLIFLYITKFFIIFSLPQYLCSLLGLTIYNAFKSNVKLKHSPLLCPHIIIRIVTRGNYPDLIQSNLIHNLEICKEIGLQNFSIEIATDNLMDIKFNSLKAKQIVVPKNYRPSSGALYKARALQYCLEDGVSEMSNGDWLVHLDEETKLTINSLKGIINFVMCNQFDIGQGLITYANEDVRNWATTSIDFYRVADDMGKLRMQLKFFNRPLFSFKGSFVVVRASVEKKVSFNNGPEGSIAEDCFFAMKAFRDGYKFGFIDGEMWEKSPFTFKDFIMQRRRWVQGTLLVVHSKQIPIKNKIFLTLSTYNNICMPILVISTIVHIKYPLPVSMLEYCHVAVGGIQSYLMLYGALKSLNLRKLGIISYFGLIIYSLVISPILAAILESIAIVLALFSNKFGFYVVDKSTITHSNNIIV